MRRAEFRTNASAVPYARMVRCSGGQHENILMYSVHAIRVRYEKASVGENYLTHKRIITNLQYVPYGRTIRKNIGGRKLFHAQEDYKKPAISYINPKDYSSFKTYCNNLLKT